VSADSQSYRVEIGATGSGTLNAMLRVAYDLISSHGSAPVWVVLESVIVFARRVSYLDYPYEHSRP